MRIVRHLKPFYTWITTLHMSYEHCKAFESILYLNHYSTYPMSIVRHLKPFYTWVTTMLRYLMIFHKPKKKKWMEWISIYDSLLKYNKNLPFSEITIKDKWILCKNEDRYSSWGGNEMSHRQIVFVYLRVHSAKLFIEFKQVLFITEQTKCRNRWKASEIGQSKLANLSSLNQDNTLLYIR